MPILPDIPGPGLSMISSSPTCAFTASPFCNRAAAHRWSPGRSPAGPRFSGSAQHGSLGRRRGWTDLLRSPGVPLRRGIAPRTQSRATGPSGAMGPPGRRAPYRLGDCCPAPASRHLRHGSAGCGLAAPRRLRAGRPAAGAAEHRMHGPPQDCFGGTGGSSPLPSPSGAYGASSGSSRLDVHHVEAAGRGIWPAAGRPAQSCRRSRGAVDPGQYPPRRPGGR